MKHAFNFFIRFPHPSRRTVLLITVAAAVITVFIVIFMLPRIVKNVALENIGAIYVSGIEAYGGDLKLEDGKQYIDWGTIYPSSSTNRSFYVQSKRNKDTIFVLETANWTFFDSDDNNVTAFFANYMTSNMTTWNYNETIVRPNESVYVTLTLSADFSPEFIDDLITYDVQKFSFDIHIYTED